MLLIMASFSPSAWKLLCSFIVFIKLSFVLGGAVVVGLVLQMFSVLCSMGLNYIYVNCP